jgi:M6 family metalloprotease-like protein
MQGDEFVRFAQTLDGYTLLYDAEGYFCYAQQNELGDIEPSSFYAKEITNRSAEVSELLTNIPKKLRYSSNQIFMYQQIRNMVDRARENRRSNTTGVRKLLTILMEYPDRPFKKTQEDFHYLFNQINHTLYGANGSVKDFFLESSYNKLEVETTVVGPFTAVNNHGFYSGDGNERVLAHEAVFAAYESGVNFADFAINGEVPSFYMIFQGCGQEAGAGQDCIWSHAWSINPVFFDGIKVSSYACSPEHRGSGGSNITRIGVICHEFGHSLGAPDYYDTNYGTGGQYDGTGNWDLQASGSWNDNGRTPPPPNPRSKVYTYGWASVTELNSAQTVTIPSARFYDNAYFRINTQTPNEYYILENKIKSSFDSYIPGENMLIYHCAANMTGMNTTSPQKFYPVAANAPVSIPGTGTQCQAHYGTINSPACPWPGSTGKQDFNNTTIPAMISWNQQPVNKPISNITVHGDYITFDILGGGEKNEYLVFLPHYFSCTIIPESGSGSPVPAGEDFVFSVSVVASHSQSTIIVKSNGVPITPSDNSYTLTNVQSDQIVTIEGLKYNTFFITASAEMNGTISPEGVVEVPVENVQRFDFNPVLGYSVDEIFVDGILVPAAPYYDFINIEEDHTISVSFKHGDKYFIETSFGLLEFAAQPGVPSLADSAIISSRDELITSIRVTAPAKFEISDDNKKWYKSFAINKTRLPFKMFIRYYPNDDDTESATGTITLCSIDAYQAIELVGHIDLKILENTASNFTIYPNPTTGELRITSRQVDVWTSEQVDKIEVYDIFGRKVEVKFPSNKLEGWQPQADGVVLNISHLQAGIYFIKISTDQEILTKKIIKH